MEREIVELRRQLATQASPIAQHSTVIKAPESVSQSPNISHIPSTLDQYMGSQEAVASLLDLRSGLDGGSYLRSPNGQMVPPKRLENVVLVHDRVQELFRQYVPSHLWPARKTIDPEFTVSSPFTILFFHSSNRINPQTTTMTPHHCSSGQWLLSRLADTTSMRIF